MNAGIGLPPEPRWLKDHWQDCLLVLGLFTLAAFVRLIRLGEFVGTDEFYIWELSNRFFLALTQGRFSDTAVHGYPAVMLMWVEAIGVWILYAVHWLFGQSVQVEALLGLDTPFAMLTEKQIVLALANSLLVVAIFWLARKAYDLPAALVGSLLVVFDPFFLAESRVVRTEGLVSGFMTLSVLALLVFWRARYRRYLFVSALMASMAALTKISALLLIPVTWAVLIFGGYSRWRSNSITLIANLLLWTLVLAFSFWLLWPAMWVAPLDTLHMMSDFSLQAGEEGFDGRGVFFAGRVYPDDPGPWFYPLALLFRTTPSTLIGVILAISTLVFRLVRTQAKSSNSTSLASDAWLRFGAAVLLFYSLFFTFAMGLGAKKYDRYLMPIFPALDLVAGIGFVQAAKVGRPSGFNIWRLILVVALVFQPLIALPHSPYYYTYFNPLFGGTKQAAKVIRVGFAEGLDIAARYLDAKPNAAELKVASANSSKISPLFSGQAIPLDNLDGRWVQADYVLIYISQVQRGKHDPAILEFVRRQDPEFIVTLHGLDYAWLYPGPAFQYYGGATKLEGRGMLWGYDLSARELQAGDSLNLRLIWRNEGQRPADRFYVRLTDVDSYVWADNTVHAHPGFENAFHTRKAIVEGKATLTLPVGMPPGQYVLKMGYEDAQTGQLIGEFALPADADDVIVTLPSVFPPLGDIQPPLPLNLVLQDELSLVGYGFDTDRVMPGDAIWLTLYWQALTDVSHDYVIGLQLLDEAGAEMTYWLGRPVRSSFPTDQWRAQQVMQDPWRLVMPPDLPSGRYSLVLSVYDAPSAQLVATSPLYKVGLTSDVD